MPDYDKYMEKLRRIAQFVPVIKKLICVLVYALCAILVWGIYTLFRIGAFSDAVTCDDIVYGEEPVYSATAYRSSVSFFFAEYGTDDWSEVPPYKVGKYTVKAVSRTVINTARKSTCDFNIVKRELIIEYNPVKVEVGEEPIPDITYKNLAKGDTVTLKEKVRVLLPEGSGEGYFAKIDSDDICITNSKNEDVTFCYEIFSEEGKITVTEGETDENSEEESSLNEDSSEKPETEEHETEEAETKEAETEETETEEAETEEAEAEEAETEEAEAEEAEAEEAETEEAEVEEPETEGVGEKGQGQGEQAADGSGEHLGQGLPDYITKRKDSFAYKQVTDFDSIENFSNSVDRESLINGKSDETLFVVTAEKSGKTLIKSTTLDKYISGGKWVNTVDLGILADYDLVNWGWVGRTLKRNGKKTYKVTISEYGKLNISTLIPYYNVNDLYSKSDVHLDYGNKSDLHEEFEFIVANEDIDEILSYKGQDVLYTDVYGMCVYKHYLDVDEKIARELRRLAQNAGISAESESVITDVSEYIKNSATYNMWFSSYPNDADPVLYFLTTAHEGLCQHFASAATLMYRALGIPARYTMGYSVDCPKNNRVSVTAWNAHAWVEVYVDKLGWVAVDPTPANRVYISESEPEPPEKIERGSVTIRMSDVISPFTGQEIQSNNYVIESGRFVGGDTFFCRGSAKEIYVGTYKNKCAEYYVLDIAGNDVTNEYDITTISGSLGIRPITLFLSTDEDLVLTEKIDKYDLSAVKWNGYGFDYEAGIDIDRPSVFEITEDNMLIGKRAANAWATFSFDGEDFNNDGVYEIEKQKAVRKIKVRSFSNVNVMNSFRDNVALDRSLFEMSDYFGNTYNCIVVEMKTEQKEFDGMPLNGNGAMVVGGSLYPGDKIVAYGDAELTYVGSVTNRCNGIKILDAGGRDVTSQYHIDVYDGTLSVVTRNISNNYEYAMNMWTSEKVYDIQYKVNSVFRNHPMEILKNDKSIFFKNNAISAVRPGEAILHGSDVEDLNGDGIPENICDEYIEINIKGYGRLYLIIPVIIILTLMIGRMKYNAKNKAQSADSMS